ncbi:MAG: DUF2190 family protein [Burkholderiaceae bacterium]|jgi:hypothetical protein|nr:DUF2190 family protein [Burkholderiaceae bacterium]
MSYQNTPLLTLSRTLSGTVAAHRFVTIGGAQAGADAVTLGVAQTAGVSGAVVPVDVIGTTIVESGAAITAGDTLESDASGRAVTWATSGAKVGKALEAATAAGQFIEILLLDNA